MRGLWKRGAIALGVVVMAGSVGLAQPPALKKDLADTPPFWSNWFGGPDKPVKLVGKDPNGEEAKGAVAPEPPPPTVASKQGKFQQLQHAFARRQAVIDRLREIAMETDNTALADEALRLEEMAQRVFRRESGKLTGYAAAVPRPDSLDGDTAGPAARGAAPAGQPARSGRGMTPESLERAAQQRGGDR